MAAVPGFGLELTTEVRSLAKLSTAQRDELRVRGIDCCLILSAQSACDVREEEERKAGDLEEHHAAVVH